MTVPDRTNDHALLAALAHPVRRRILRAMADGEPASPGDLATRLGQPLSNLSYHVRVLAECEAVKLVDEEQTKGSTRHLYRSSVEAEWARSLLAEEEDEPPAGGSQI